MNSQQTVDTFLEFFRERGHHPIPGQSLVPRPGDPVLFTTSGMHPLTPYLEGQPHPDGGRLADVQRCLRTTDLDEVGDRTHLTVFEMLGSWSLGDYTGPQSVRWGYELVTGGFGIDPGRLHATVFGGGGQVGPDTDLLEVWGELGVPVELTGTDNWWSNGPTGLCGTDSELFVWTGGTPPQDSESYGADAVTHSPSGPIDLLPNFYGLSANTQASVLIHEGIHLFGRGQLGDTAVQRLFGLPVSGNTDNITQYILGGCKHR